jgi:hypothetical protein
MSTSTDAVIAMPALSKRQRYLKRRAQLDEDRQTWETTWKDIGDYMAPYRGRFTSRGDQTNKGDRRDSSIINCEPELDIDVQAAGLMAGLTSPSRPWVRVETADPDLNEWGPVKEWSDLATRRLLRVYEMSNFYGGMHQLYKDICGFGTSVMHIDEDVEEIIRAYVFPCGSYWIANNAKQRVDSCYREISMTPRELVGEFGMDRVSPQVRAMVQQQNAEGLQRIKVLHAMQPNGEWQYNRAGVGGMKFSSCWLEVNADDNVGLLRESGFYEQPFVAPRWDTTGNDAYGRGPGHQAIGDAKALQLIERRKLQGAEKLVDPPMNLPSSYRDLQVALRPGSQIYQDSLSPNDGARPAFMVDPRGIEAMREEARDHMQRIGKATRASLWTMLAQIDAGTMTAEEVRARRGEQMLQMGPMIERFFAECIRPANARTFGIMIRRRLLPPPPKEVLQAGLKFEYTSILAQAQKATGIQGMREFTGFVVEVANAQRGAGVPVTVLDKLDEDQIVDEYAMAIGVPAKVVRTDEEVQAKRQKRQQAEAAVQRAQEVQQGAETAKTLAAADTSGDNALTNVLDAIGVNKPTGT